MEDKNYVPNGSEHSLDFIRS